MRTGGDTVLDRLEHVGVMVTDIDRSIGYDTNVLGLALRERRTLGDVELPSSRSATR